MISDKALLAFLKDGESNCLSETNLKRILDEELEKPEEEMDTDLVEYCLDTLEKLERTAQNSGDTEKEVGTKNKKTTLRLKRVLITAAVLSVLVIGAVSVSAVFPEIKLLDGIVEFYDEYIRVRYDKASDNVSLCGLQGSNLAQELKANGIVPIVLPEALMTDEYNLSDITYEKFDTMTSAYFNFDNNESHINGYAVVEQFDDKSFLPAIDFQGVEDSLKLTVSGIDVYVFKQKQGVSISYQERNTQYNIVLSENVSIDEATALAKTIK